MPRHRRALVIALASLVALTVVGATGWVTASARSADRVTVAAGTPPVCDDPRSHAAKPVREDEVVWPTLRVDSRLRCRVAAVVRNESSAPITVTSIEWPSVNVLKVGSRAPLNWVASTDGDDDSVVLASASGGEDLPPGGSMTIWTWMVFDPTGCLSPRSQLGFEGSPGVDFSVLGRQHSVNGIGPTIAFKGTAESARGCDEGEVGTGGM
ncbi:hypothetical protein KV102_11465 [Mumia sp. zg.B53]|uniref:hypothetical protein n=1 Tax=Mumia sp. zg.B53 TaxID=2855449 RepID=UPI001C6F4434|nr:hypothetical protein [Mumia sp. zg.B53]MBW9215459.1 hypothetical protein [Mumia sp. zg.B53]